jgi:cysteine-rich repeat protein
MWALIPVLMGGACTSDDREAATAWPGQPLTVIPVVSSRADFNGTAIAAGSTLWFTSVMKVSGVGSRPVHLYFNQAHIQFSANDSNYDLPVPDANITIDPAATLATTDFNPATQTWETVLPVSGAGYRFLGGLAWQVPTNLPGGIKPVVWSASFESDAPITVSWRWSAAVYSTFSTDYRALLVKPVDDNTHSVYQNKDHAGTPEAFKSFLIAGGRGGGGANYTGSLNAAINVIPVQPCTADVVCASPDQCHEAGTCDVRTGLCALPAKTDGTPCDDGDACTQTDACQAGACVGGNPISCVAADQCHEAGTCDPASGACSNPVAPDQTPCNDGDACTQTDACQAGACVGSNPVVCSAPGCSQPGTCDPATGMCGAGTGCGPACGNGVVEGDPPRSLAFEWLATSCSGQDEPITFQINGQTVVSGFAWAGCSCQPGVNSFATTDPAALALIQPGNNVFSVSTPGKLAWASVRVVRHQSTDAVPLYDAGGGGDALSRNPDLCAAGADVPASGSAVIQGGEACDDGNTVSGDGCSAACRIEP